MLHFTNKQLSLRISRRGTQVDTCPSNKCSSLVCPHNNCPRYMYGDKLIKGGFF